MSKKLKGSLTAKTSPQFIATSVALRDDRESQHRPLRAIGYNPLKPLVLLLDKLEPYQLRCSYPAKLLALHIIGRVTDPSRPARLGNIRSTCQVQFNLLRNP